MSEEEFESYLGLLGRFLRLSESQRETIARELRDHMEDRLEELMERGHSRDEAIRIALDEFGDAAALAADFSRIGRRRKWIMRTTAATMGIAATVLIVSFLLPENRAFVPAPPLTRADESKPAAAATPVAQGRVFTAASDGGDVKPAAFIQTIPEMTFEETSFESVVEFLAEQNDLNIHVNWNALEIAGIDRKTGVSIKAKNVKLETALKLILDGVGGGNAPLGYMIRDGVVVITTQEDLDTHTVVRVYDCRDLIPRPLTNQQRQILETMAREVSSNKGESIFPDDQVRFTASQPVDRMNDHEQRIFHVLDALRERDVEVFLGLIRTTITPDGWRDNGGVTSSALEYDGMLVIRCPVNVHQEIVELLDMMRQATASRTGAGLGDRHASR